MPCDYSKYPKDWPQIRARILERDKYRCKFCCVRQYGVGYHTESGFQYTGGNIYLDDFQYTESYQAAREVADHANEWCAGDEPRLIVIVLTIAHLHDPNPQNCSEDNVAALCQRCHNRLDAKMRAQNRKKKRGVLQLELEAA